MTQRTIQQVLTDERFTFRTLSAIAQGTGMTLVETADSLRTMIAEGEVVARIRSRDEAEIFALRDRVPVLSLTEALSDERYLFRSMRAIQQVTEIEPSELVRQVEAGVEAGELRMSESGRMVALESRYQEQLGDAPEEDVSMARAAVEALANMLPAQADDEAEEPGVESDDLTEAGEFELRDEGEVV